MIITIDPGLEAQLRKKAEARHIPVDSYVHEILERDVNDGQVDSSQASATLVQRGSLLMVAGELPVGYDIVKAIDDDRSERARKVLAL